MNQAKNCCRASLGFCQALERRQIPFATENKEIELSYIVYGHDMRGWFSAARVAQCIDKEILIGKNCNIDIGIDIDNENFEKLITY